MLQKGTVICSKYRLCHLIAEGGMSEVYLAQCIKAPNKLPKFYAIKRLLPALAKKNEFVEMFYDEAKISLSLSHKNLLSCVEVVPNKNNDHFMVFEFVSGKDLGLLSSSIQMRSNFEKAKIAVLIGIEIC